MGKEIKSRYRYKRKSRNINKKRRNKRRKKKDRKKNSKEKNKSGNDKKVVNDNSTEQTPIDPRDNYEEIDQLDPKEVVASEEGPGSENDKAGTEGDAIAGDFEHIRTDEKVYFNFNFATDQAQLQQKDKETLDELVELMKSDSSLQVKIEGHTDDVGTEEYNIKLSERRAESVADYLISNGIMESRIEFLGWGESKPLVENNSSENRATNRRVEFTIMENDSDN
ncbi:OmpA family protein [Mangrovivirga cuniculi]|uniref:OmpA family protein n=1 Tax=Mangrovivirga cuniculi TaxID=2715131 RepID=UPI001586E4AA|nr:OmpA family protein [Mangrovivirga cuniculi]